MIEFCTKDGDLIATIHDPKLFSGVLDEFEKLTRLYVQLSPPQGSVPVNRIYGVNQALLDALLQIAERLDEIRKQLGDNRANLYPVDIKD